MKKLNQNGFTLLETLVAVIVLSISIVIIMQLFSSNLKSLPNSDLHARAVFHARAKMEEVLLADVFMQSQSTGTFDDIFSWTVTIIKEEPENITEEPENLKPESNKAEQEVSLFDLFRIDLEVFWKNGDKEKSYMISTLTSVVI